MNQKEKYVGWLTALLMFALMQPYFLWELNAYYNYLFRLPLYIILFLNMDKGLKELKYALFYGSIVVLAAVCFQQSLVGILFDLGLVTLFLAKKSFLFGVYRKVWMIYVVVLSLSLANLLLVSLGVPLPSQIIAPLNDLKSHGYLAYPFLVIPYSIDSIRFCSVFDEPGVVGTFSFLFLIIEQANLKKVGNIVILVGGILSFSLFFYLGLGIYLVYRLILSKGGYKNKLVLLLFTVIAITVVVSNETMQEMILSRVEWDSEKGTISGDDRAHGDLKQYVERLRGTKAYYWGIHNKSVIESYGGSASIQNAILKYGFVAVALFFVFYAVYAYPLLRFSLTWFFFMGVLFILIYNRPTMFELSRLFLYNMTLFGLYYNAPPDPSMFNGKQLKSTSIKIYRGEKY